MTKMFDKVSQDFLNAIKGVLEAKKVNKHGHDRVGEEDDDLDNDGDSDNSDKYLHARRKAIGKAMKKEESDTPFAGPYSKAGDRKDKYGNTVKNVAKHLAKKAMNDLAKKNEEVEEIDEMSSKMKMKLGLYGKKKKMKEEEAAGQKYEVRFANGKTQRFIAATPEEAKKKAKGLNATSLIKINRDGLSQGKVEEIDEMSSKMKMKLGLYGKKKKMKEEADQIDEISSDMKSRYKKSAQRNLDQAQDFKSELDFEGDPKGSRVRKDVNRIIKNRKTGMKRANEEAEALDELSTDTMKSYGDKRARTVFSGGRKPGESVDAAIDRKSKQSNMLSLARTKINRVQRTGSTVNKESVEALDELSKDTMRSYMDKASDARSHRKLPTKKVDNRYSGVQKASSKLTEEEIEMIEAMMAGVASGSMDGDKHMCATKVFHKEWAEGTPIKTMHADPDADGLIEWYDVMFDHGIERVMTEDMEILQAESHMHSKKKMKEEAEELDESAKVVDHLIKRYGDNVRKSHVMSAANDFGVGYTGLSRMVRKKLGVDRLKEDTELEEEQIDELSKDTMLKYLSANKKSGARGGRDTIKRMRGADMAVRKYTARDTKYVRVPATEEVELDEARGRPKKAAAKDFTVHPITKKKLMHDNPEDMKTIGLLQKNKVLEVPKTEAGQHVINQLQKAKTSMQGGSTIHFTHGESKHVSGSHAAKLITKYQGMKPSEKEDFQKKIGHSHAELMKHV